MGLGLKIFVLIVKSLFDLQKFVFDFVIFILDFYMFVSYIQNLIFGSEKSRKDFLI